MKNILHSSILATLVLSGLATASPAATIWTGNTDDDFGTAGNWDNGLPGAIGVNQNADISNGDIVNLTSNYSAANTYRLRVTSGTLNASADFTSTHFQINSGSTVNLTGGNYTLTQTSGPNNGTAGNAPSISGTLNISGGTHVFNERMGGGGAGVVRVIGDDATISFHQIGGYSGTFAFQFDSTGVSTITGAGGFPWFSLNTAFLEVDGSAYTGDSGTFTLLDSTDAAGAFFDAGDITISGFGSGGYVATLKQFSEGGRKLVELQVKAIPEPSTLALLGLGAAVMHLSRRRQTGTRI